MTDLPESNQTYPEAIAMIEHNEVAYGGDVKLTPNKQLLALANRCAYLKNIVDEQQKTLNDYQSEIANLKAAIATIENAITTLQPKSSILDQFAALSSSTNNTILGRNTVGAVTEYLRDKFQPIISTVFLADKKDTGTSGGTGQSTNTGTTLWTGIVWNDRIIAKTGHIGIDFCTIQADGATFSLPPGSYQVLIRAPATMVDKHKLRLFNATKNEAVGDGRGSSVQTLSASAVSGQSLTTDGWIICPLILINQELFKIQHVIYDTISGRSLGAETGVPGEPEIYTQAFINKLR